MLAGAAAGSHAGAGIYTCVDAKGRRLTADRPIIDCLDREQKELNPSGSVRRRIGPSLTGQERAAEEDKARRAIEEQMRLDAEKKRDRALLDRYADAASHTRSREAALDLADRTLAGKPVELLAERARVNARFDEELIRLRQLWNPQNADVRR